MPTLALLTPADARPAGASPDAWHRVAAPGGYEWWHFDAEDASGDVQLVAAFHDGFAFHPGYLRAHARYLRRSTRVAPAVPSQYPCASFAVYEKGSPAARFLTQYSPGAFQGSDERPEARVGLNVLQADAAGVLRLSLAGPTPDPTPGSSTPWAGQALSAELWFRSLRACSPPTERRFLSRELTGADHHWVLANPLCEVEGTVRIPAGGGAGGGRALAFRGRGYHDHCYGTGPIGSGLHRWVRGRVLLAERVVAFHAATPANRDRPDEVRLVACDPAGAYDVPNAGFRLDGAGRTRAGLAYPRRLKLGDALELHSPRVVEASGFFVRLTYDAVYEGERGRALCEVVYPGRLRWPVLGRVIERAIQRVGI